MLQEDRSEYLILCNGYRIITFIFSTVTYIVSYLYLEENKEKFGWGIVLGMTVSCVISTWLYRKIINREIWLNIMLYMEIFAYGIFMNLSGGFSSPYLWYYISTIFIVLIVEKYIAFFIALIWGLLNSVLGNLNREIGYQDFNIALGIIMVIGGFYVLNFYVKILENKKQLLYHSNSKLEKEKTISENAFIQLTNLYETFNIFAMNNSDRILSSLAELLRKVVASSGCILLKFDSEGMIEKSAYSGMDAALANEIIDNINIELNREFYGIEFNDLISSSHDGRYEVRMIGNTILYRGAFIREKQNISCENEDFYWNLIELIFTNMDIYSQTETFIIMEEQNRIANEIHDTVLQKLFGIACNLKVTEMKIADMDIDEQKNYLSNIKKSIEMTMTEIRESIYGRSFIKNIDSFTEMMQKYMEEAENLSEVYITMDLDEDAEYMSSAQKVAVYRISCEAVNNAIRHGKAQNIGVNLRIDNENIKLEIKDDGSGIRKHKRGLYEGNGLNNMRNTAALLKGKLFVEKGKTSGMIVSLNLPR